jgi:adenine-specific DNA-methyltransferase
MSEALTKFQDLLRDLFQFDSADLDFGIYRIMNHKRDVVERFIAQDLPAAIAEEVNRDALARQLEASQKAADARNRLVAALGEDALDADGNLKASYHASPVGKDYLSARAQAGGARSREAIEASNYNHLFTFFSRYYQDGDFISKRRYSKRERYAIPYNGEEVYLYWDNHDQYYVKTGEYFTDYAFSAPNGVRVHFKLRAADVEQNNVKGEKRFFVPSPIELTWDEAARQLIIPFEFRPLAAQEGITSARRTSRTPSWFGRWPRSPRRSRSRPPRRPWLPSTQRRAKPATGVPSACSNTTCADTPAEHVRFLHPQGLKGFLDPRA